MRVPTARSTRNGNRMRKRDPGFHTAGLQLHVANREDAAFLEDLEAASADTVVGSALAGVDVYVSFLSAVAARVGQGSEWGYADADETGCDFRFGPKENLR